MAPEAHPKTLFHLVLLNQIAQDALLHPDNKRRVSNSKAGPGLEIGLGPPSNPCLRFTSLSKSILLHISYFYPSDRSGIYRSGSRQLKIKMMDGESTGGNVTGKEMLGEAIDGDGVILYGQSYKIFIACYEFKLIWRTISETYNDRYLKALTVQGYEISQRLLQDVRSRDRPTKYDHSEAQSWHITRLNSAKDPTFRDIKSLRERIGNGAFGQVYSAVDQKTGHKFAIKVVHLKLHGNNVERSRASLHKEIKVMQRVKHPNIIENLGHQGFDTPSPEIFMPLRAGSLYSLAQSPPFDISYHELCNIAMKQMLSALDYLASLDLIHRDLKPENILYSKLNDGYLFQLADFGLAHYRSLATTFCGTGYYQAPELWPSISGVNNASQSTKMDIWSLYACFIAVASNLKQFPPDTHDYRVALSTLRTMIPRIPKLEPMTRLHPDRRATAAQMLVVLFNGEGLTTPISQIPPIEPDVPVAVPSRYPTNANHRDRIPQQPTAITHPLIVYPPRRRTTTLGPPGNARLAPPIWNRGGNLTRPNPPQLQPIRAHRDGVVKRRSEPRAHRAQTLIRPPPEQKPPVPTGSPPVQDPRVLDGQGETLPRMPGEFPD